MHATCRHARHHTLNRVPIWARYDNPLHEDYSRRGFLLETHRHTGSKALEQGWPLSAEITGELTTSRTRILSFWVLSTATVSDGHRWGAHLNNVHRIGISQGLVEGTS